jgi:hypothetical protein
MGEYNNTAKMKWTLTGKIYDINNELVTSNETITFAYCDFGYYHVKPVPIENGTYSVQILANPFSRDYVYLSGKKINIQPFTLDIEPDSIHIQDIYLLEDYTAIAEESQPDLFPVHIYPNPLSGGQALHYEVGAPVKSLDCRIELISMDGRTVFESKITDNTGSVNLPNTLPTGTYIVNFKLNHKTQYSTRLIIGK